MCYEKELQHEGIKIIIGDCFGVGFDWNDPELKKAVESRDKRVWEIMDWIVKGGADLCNKAFVFDSEIAHHGLSYAYSIISDFYKTDDLESLLKNRHLSSRSRDIINAYFEGTLKEQAQAERERERASNKKNKAVKGVVYLLRSGGYYKIGKTKNLPARIDTLAVGVRVPFDIQLVHSFKSNDYSSAEAGLHRTFESKRTEGEWFTLSPEDIEFICSLQDGML